MTDFKVGDRVKVEFEGVVSYVGTHKHIVKDADDNGMWVLPDHLTLLGPVLPTENGSVVRSHGYTFTLTTNGWLAHTDKSPYTPEQFKRSMYSKRFEVLFDAGNQGGK